LAEAVRFSASHPITKAADYDEVLARFSRVMEEFGGTPAALEAERHAQEWEAKRSEVAARLLAAAKEFAAANPTDFDGFLRRLEDVGWAYRDAPAGETAWREMPVILGKRREASSRAHNAAQTNAAGHGVPKAWQARLETDAQKRARIAAAGGVPETEDAVLKALDYLKQSQHADGSWEINYKVAMTSFALLAFTAHGETPSSARYGATVQRAIDYLRPLAEKGPMGELPEYETAMATCALAEVYGLTGDKSLEAPLKLCVYQLLSAQTQRGGWGHLRVFKPPAGLKLAGYQSTPVGSADISITSWHIQALQAAHEVGIERQAIEPALDRAVAFIKWLYSPTLKEFGYVKPDGGWSHFGMGVLSLQLWGAGRDAEVTDALSIARRLLFFGVGMSADKIAGEFDEGKRGENSLYMYFFLSQAMFLYDGPTGEYWKGWVNEYCKTLVRSQGMDGRFLVEDWPWPSYTAAVGALMLTVPYRILPPQVVAAEATGAR
jgi:hypothetical protein